MCLIEPSSSPVKKEGIAIRIGGQIKLKRKLKQSRNFISSGSEISSSDRAQSRRDHAQLHDDSRLVSASHLPALYSLYAGLSNTFVIIDHDNASVCLSFDC